MLNILVLHNIEVFSRSRRNVLNAALGYERHNPQNNFVYYNINWPAVASVRTFPWDLIIIESTALGIVTFRPRALFEECLASWAFLSDIPAIKIALPQDDADHCALLDQTFVTLGIDIVFSVRPDFKEVLYPRASKTAKFCSVFSGYIENNEMQDLERFSKPFAERTITIGQRVFLYPPHGGRLARLKGEAALALKAAAISRGVDEDISTNPDNVLYGDDWYRFLGNSKFTVGAEGGLGMLDPVGEVYDAVQAFMNSNPAASFEEVEANCFPGLDGNPEMPGFSPRFLEAAALGCCQILVEGEYRGVMRPYEHYIPLKRDFSNMPEVFSNMRDETLVRSIVENCRRDLLESGRFLFTRFVSMLFDEIETLRSTRGVPPVQSRTPDVIGELNRETVTMLRDKAMSQGLRGSAVVDHVLKTVSDAGPSRDMGIGTDNLLNVDMTANAVQLLNADLDDMRASTAASEEKANREKEQMMERIKQLEAQVVDINERLTVRGVTKQLLPNWMVERTRAGLRFVRSVKSARSGDQSEK